MKKSLLITLPLLAAFAAGPVLAKHKHDRHDHRDRHGYDRRHDHRDNGRHHGWRDQRWRRGDRVEVVYIDRTYYVNDYARYNLRQPPRGYVWVQPQDDRYLLVQLATGLIEEALGY